MTKKLKAWMVAYTYYESDNRVRRYAETLAERGDDVSVIALRRQGQGEYGEFNGVKIYRIQERRTHEMARLYHG